MMKKILWAVLAILAVSPAKAANNTVVITPGSGVTMRSFDIGAGVEAMGHIIVDSAGAAIYGTAGTANAAVLSIQGIASGTQVGIKTVSGAIASGSIASGAVAAGAIAAGALVAGAAVDGWNLTQGALADTVCATDNGTCSAQALVKRTNQRLTSLIALLPTALGSTTSSASSPVVIASDQAAVATKAASGAFVDGANATQGAQADAACSTDTATCTLISLLKRLNQNLTTINATASGSANIAAAATGGCTPGVILSAASNNSANIKASAGTLCELSWIQTTATLMDIRLYDTASAPTCSSATGVVANYVAQSNVTSAGGSINLGPFGKAFTSGIGVCITGANANNDNTNAATGLNVNYSYK